MQRFYKSQEHRNYTKALNKIIPSNESKEKSARAQKCLDEFNIELPPRIVTSNSKVALVLDRDYENSEEPRKRPALTKTGIKGISLSFFKSKNISSLFESYRSKALAHAQNSGLLVTKNYHEILSLSHILLLQMDNYSEMQIKNIRYIEIALDDDDGGLCKLRKTIINSFSKTFDSTAEDEFFQRMQFLFQHLAYTILLRISSITVGNIYEGFTE
ncbi:hypothetical protein GLOIN_2v1780441 [Rhizophagus irregularis DAOM 181602=DAOM 197198]|nr:hypothetical protein GLOIN_2v1780441 [Rhizophagus irregularis DAOM 181602=DAOM 197198]